MSQIDMRVIELSRTVQIKLLKLKEYTNKEEVISIANYALNRINDDDEVSKELKEAYKLTISKFSSMTWEEMKNIIAHI